MGGKRPFRGLHSSWRPRPFYGDFEPPDYDKLPDADVRAQAKKLTEFAKAMVFYVQLKERDGSSITDDLESYDDLAATYIGIDVPTSSEERDETALNDKIRKILDGEGLQKLWAPKGESVCADDDGESDGEGGEGDGDEGGGDGEFPSGGGEGDGDDGAEPKLTENEWDWAFRDAELEFGGKEANGPAP